MSRADLERVHEILGCVEGIDRAEGAMLRNPGDLDVAQVALDAARHRLLRIGEAVNGLSLEMREDHPAVPWSVMARIGDLLGHSDDNLDAKAALVAIAGPLKHLRTACQAILGESVRVGEDEP